MIAAETIDGVLVEDVEVVGQPSQALVRRERRSEVIRPLDTTALVESFHAYQELLPQLLTAADYQDAGKDKDGNPRRFVKKSGWRKIATAFDLDVQIVRSTVDRDEHGQPQRAEVWARAVAPSGRSMDGDGYCSVDEERFGKAGDADWKIAKARAKLENDLRATATTRAMNRAISGLVGMGEVSAEEVSATPDAEPEGLPKWALDCSPAQVTQLRKYLAYLIGGDEDGAGVAAILAKIEKDHGAPGIPWIASRAVGHVAANLKALREGKDLL